MLRNKIIVCHIVLLLVTLITETKGGTPTQRRYLRRNTELVERRKYNDEQFTPEPRIIGGELSAFNMHPYFVLIMDKREDGQVYKSGCAGTLIQEGGGEWVLTSAHCLANQTRVDFAYIGAFHPWDATSFNGGQDFDFIGIEDVYVHDQWDEVSFSYDFALLRLKSISDQPTISLATDNLVLEDGDDLDIIGFGVTEIDNPTEEFELHEATVSYVPNQKCSQQYESVIPAEMLCASGNGVTDACQGDSGGPLMKRHPITSQMIQVGITSWGKDCALKDYPGVYARVSEAQSWMQSIICQYSTEEATKNSDWCSDYLGDPSTSTIETPPTTPASETTSAYSNTDPTASSFIDSDVSSSPTPPQEHYSDNDINWFLERVHSIELDPTSDESKYSSDHYEYDISGMNVP